MATMSITQLDPALDLDCEEAIPCNGDDRLIPPPQSWFGKDYQDEVKQPARARQVDSVQNHDEMYPQDGSRTSNERRSGDFMPMCIVPHPELSQISSVGSPQRAPSWRELSSQVLPSAAKELLSASMQRIVHTARLSYAKGRWQRNFSDFGNPNAGYFRQDLSLPPFSSLSWIDRQLVREWRTIGEIGESDEDDFQNARTLVPKTLERKKWQKSDICLTCRKPFGPTLLRHHCRLCGHSFCHAHSSQTHQLHHLGYDPNVPERVCLECKHALLEQNLAERVAVSSIKFSRYRCRVIAV